MPKPHAGDILYTPAVPLYHMDSHPLPNYLLSNRKRLGLTQADVAWLVDAKSGEKVCRHERFLREPSLATALAYEAIYKRSVSELFSGLYQEAERNVRARAKLLAEKTQGRNPDRRSARRREVLAGIAGTKPGRNVNPQ